MLTRSAQVYESIHMFPDPGYILCELKIRETDTHACFVTVSAISAGFHAGRHRFAALLPVAISGAASLGGRNALGVKQTARYSA